MPTYTYSTPTHSGEYQLVAESLPAAVKTLRDAGIMPTSVGEPHPDSVGDGRITESDLCGFARQLASLLESGTPLVQALHLLANESESDRLRRAVAGLAAEVADGIPLSAAMGRRPRAFGPVVSGLVEAGETGGNLEEALRAIAEQREGFARIARQSVMVLVYPTAVLLFGFCMVSFLLAYSVPKFLSLFRELGIEEFPTPTLILMRASEGFPLFFLALVATGTGLVVMWILGRKKTRGRIIMDYWRLGAPILGRINLNLALARVSGALGLLLSSGVPIVQALRLAGAAAGNGVIAAAFRRGERAVSEGRSLADGLRESGVIPESFTWRIAVGESAGTVPDTLKRMTDYYVEAALLAAKGIQGLLEPFLIILLGFIVISVVVGLFMPLISIVGSLSS
ncbi:MAG TPA: type II secretion system F family protein [Armatimonadota bacterium]|nr:type II secretion system F family protein [Armatimonadota bacterium]